MSECIAPCCISPLSDAFKLVGTENLVYSFTRTHAEAKRTQAHSDLAKTQTQKSITIQKILMSSVLSKCPRTQMSVIVFHQWPQIELGKKPNKLQPFEVRS